MERTKEFYVNGYGVKIVKCCASCGNKVFDKGMTRKCKCGFGVVKSGFLCKDKWTLAAGLDRAGKGGGRVKRGDYLKCYVEGGRGAIEDWEKQHGSKYLEKK